MRACLLTFLFWFIFGTGETLGRKILLLNVKNKRAPIGFVEEKVLGVAGGGSPTYDSLLAFRYLLEKDSPNR